MVVFVCLFVCLLICQQDYLQSNEHIICIKLGPRNNPFNFGYDPDYATDPGSAFGFEFRFLFRTLHFGVDPDWHPDRAAKVYSL